MGIYKINSYEESVFLFPTFGSPVSAAQNAPLSTFLLRPSGKGQGVVYLSSGYQAAGGPPVHPPVTPFEMLNGAVDSVK